jgi:tRNA threonylcarbamoyladenosine biosynthesis protein TsaE
VPILKEGELDYISHSPDQTRRLGSRLGALLQPGDVVCLSGDLGTGKTVFANGVGAGWGSIDPMISPTYTIVHEHRRDSDNLRLQHLDCYRLRGPEDANSIAFDDLVDDSISILLIEWPERVLSILPEERLWIQMRSLDPTHRRINLSPIGARYLELVQQFKQSISGT